MWKVVFLIAALALSVSPLDAAPKEGKRMEKSERGELRRDVERISKEIYPPQQKQQRRRR
jgi:hypothetical protein